MCHLLAGTKFLMLCLYMTTQPNRGRGRGARVGWAGPLPAWFCLGQQQHTPSNQTCSGHLGEGETQPIAEAWEANTEQSPLNFKLGTGSLPEAACKTPVREGGSDRTWTGAAAACLKPGLQPLGYSSQPWGGTTGTGPTCSLQGLTDTKPTHHRAGGSAELGWPRKPLILGATQSIVAPRCLFNRR